MDTSVLKPTQWGLIFALLSMEVIIPLYEDMGLELSDKKRFVDMLRRLILENRKVYEANPGVVPPLAAHVLEEMEKILGKDQTWFFYRWVTSVFIEIHSDLPQWSAWQILFDTCAYNDRMRDRLGLPPEKRDAILAQYRKALNVSDVEQKMAELKALPLSDWDLEMYSIHQFHNDELSSPFDSVLRVVEMNRFQLFWEELLPQLSAGEKIRMQKESQRLLKEMEIWMPENEELRYPDNLRRQL
jgi:hypothetical protein